MRNLTPWVLGLVLSAGGGWGVYQSHGSTGERPDCPGKIVCPLAGDEVCVDRCPADATKASAVSANAADELCGGTCPAPAPKPDKPKGEGDEQSAVAIPASPTPLRGGCCR